MQRVGDGKPFTLVVATSEKSNCQGDDKDMYGHVYWCHSGQLPYLQCQISSVKEGSSGLEHE